MRPPMRFFAFSFRTHGIGRSGPQTNRAATRHGLGQVRRRQFAIPFPNVIATTADVKVTEFILTPKVGYRLLDQEKIKIDTLTGFRYWHLGQNLQFSPSRLGLNFSGSQNWVDALVGGRILGALTPKVRVAIGGDVGGWGTGSQLDYQIFGRLGYKTKPKWTLQAGYRYLDVNYRSKTVYDAATSGIVLGVSISLK